MSDFLLELLAEEIPARMQVKAKADLARLFVEGLAKAGVTAGEVETFATPRRLALIARGLPPAAPASVEERKGPRTSAPAAALDGFLRSTGLTRDALTERDGIWFATITKSGQAMPDVLAAIVVSIVRGFPWPKSMRWGDASATMDALRWVRPLQGIVALFDREVVPVEIGGIVSGAATVGHRFHHAGPITIGGADDYVEKLRACHVIVHFSERCALIREGATAAAVAAGLRLVDDEGLVVENAGLTEWPVPLLGRFDAAFLAVPPEVVQLTMRTNQKYFACTDAGGALTNAFVCTANIAATDGGSAIVAGNERVLSARLADAKFFWDNDLRVSLETQAEKLSGIVFHEKLGTVADKVERVAKLARWLCEEGIVKPLFFERRREATPSEAEASTAAEGLDFARQSPSTSLGEEGLADLAERAARLCKADLVTGMVGEFPELQGIIGGHLARAQGEHAAVADAIRDHYKPVGQGDAVPTSPVTVAVSLADKLDTLAGFFGRGMSPTGSKDPFALRRAMISVLSLLVDNRLTVAFADLLLAATGNFFAVVGSTRRDLLDFAIDRLKVQQRDAGVRHDLIDAVFALGGEDDLVRLLARVRALQAFVTTDDGAKLLGGYKRAANILKKDAPPLGSDASAPLSYTPETCETALADALDAAIPRVEAAIVREDFEDAMTALAALRTPIDAFFDGVIVNDPDPGIRAARLALLDRFRAAVHQVADFSKIEG